MDIRALQGGFGLWLDRGATYLDGIPLEILLVALLLPLLLAVISARILVIVGTILFLLAAVVVLVRPALAGPAIAVVMWAAGVIMAVAAIASRRAYRAVQAQLDTLQQELVQLQARESQRYFTELRHGPTSPESDGRAVKPEIPNIGRSRPQALTD